MIPKKIIVVGQVANRVQASVDAWSRLHPSWAVSSFTDFDPLRFVNYQSIRESVERHGDLGYSHVAAYEKVIEGGVVVHWSLTPTDSLDSLLTDNVRAFVSANPDLLDPRIIGGEPNHPFWWAAITRVWNTSQQFSRVDRQCGGRFLQALYDQHGPATGVVPFHWRLLTGTPEECERVGGVSYVQP